jgi:hypothetical protein
MNIHIIGAENNLNIKHDEGEVFIYDLNGIADLTEFVKYISESDTPIECTPANLDQFKEATQDPTDEMLKLVEYILKIIDSFNEGYAVIYQTEGTE